MDADLPLPKMKKSRMTSLTSVDTINDTLIEDLLHSDVNIEDEIALLNEIECQYIDDEVIPRLEPQGSAIVDTTHQMQVGTDASQFDINKLKASFAALSPEVQAIVVDRLVGVLSDPSNPSKKEWPASLKRSVSSSTITDEVVHQNESKNEPVSMVSTALDTFLSYYDEMNKPVKIEDPTSLVPAKM
jgi:hypothetical protein